MGVGFRCLFFMFSWRPIHFFCFARLDVFFCTVCMILNVFLCRNCNGSYYFFSEKNVEIVTIDISISGEITVISFFYYFFAKQ
jgi:hypothetical protein